MRGALEVRKGITGWRVARHWRRFALVACVAFVGVGTASTAFARSRHHDGEDRGREKGGEPTAPAGPLFLVISTNKQHVSVYGRNGLYEVSPVSTGEPDHPTPHGIFSIIGKERFHRSNLYNDAPMPYMQRMTWSGVAMHEGVLPGYAASHGCVRLPHEFAQRLYNYTEGNERIVISHQDIAPASISHPRLFEPKLMEPPGLSVASESGQMLQSAIALTESSRLTGDAKKLEIAVTPDGQDVMQAAPGQKLLNPFEFAKAMKSLATKRADETAAALSLARNTIEAKAKAVSDAAFAVRKAEIALANAKDAVEAADRRVKKAAADEEASKAAVDAKVQAEAKAWEAEAALSAAQRLKSEMDRDAALGPAPAILEAREAASAVRKAEIALAKSKDLLETAHRRVKRTAVDAEALKAAAEAKAQAEAKTGAAEASLSAAQRVKSEKDRDSAPMLAAMEAKAAEAKEAASGVRKAEFALAEAKDLLSAADQRVKRTAGDEEASKAAADAKVQAEAKAGEAEAALSGAQRVKSEKDRDAAPVLAAMEAKAKEAKEAALAVHKAEVTLATAKDAAETADRRVKRAAAEEEAAKAAIDAKVQAGVKAGEAEAALSAAQRVKFEKDQEAAPVLAAMEAKAKEAKEAALAVRKAEVVLATAKDAAKTAGRQVKRTAVEAGAPKSAAEAKTQAEARVVEAEAALLAAQRTKTEKEQDAASALKAYNDAGDTRKAAADVAKFWNRRLSPLSIFVSRKTQRLYVRQGHDSVFDVPVTIRDPEKPLGTHVYVAMPPLTDAQGSASSLHWLVLTIPDASTDSEEPRRHRRRHNDDDEAAAAAVPAASASEALDRIEVAPEVREKISEMLWAGSSLIVSDKAISGETDDSTDFIILTR
jgi:lipoprotein-anchoring transpeptidase ErfK/SrfK